MHVLDWLLEDDAPGVAYLTRLGLLGESPDARRMMALRRRCNEYSPVARMLARVDKCIGWGRPKSDGWAFWGNYNKYRGSYWTLIFLAELQADSRDARIRRLAEHVLATQLDDSGFSASGAPRFEIVCLTANTLRSLVHSGYGDDERVLHGYERSAERILPHVGVPRIVLRPRRPARLHRVQAPQGRPLEARRLTQRQDAGRHRTQGPAVQVDHAAGGDRAEPFRKSERLTRNGIHELRIALQGVNYRVLYFFNGTATVVVSHGLTKERLVPPREIESTIARRGEVKSNPKAHLVRPEAWQ